MKREEKELYIKHKLGLIKELMATKNIRVVDLGRDTNYHPATISTILNGKQLCSVNYIDTLYNYCSNAKEKIIYNKTYIVVTNDEYELIVALGTLKEISNSTKFTYDMMYSALRVGRQVIMNKKFKLIEYDLDELESEN
jgi:hypothetical protein